MDGPGVFDSYIFGGGVHLLYVYLVNPFCIPCCLSYMFELWRMALLARRMMGFLKQVLWLLEAVLRCPSGKRSDVIFVECWNSCNSKTIRDDSSKSQCGSLVELSVC